MCQFIRCFWIIAIILRLLFATKICHKPDISSNLALLDLIRIFYFHFYFHFHFQFTVSSWPSDCLSVLNLIHPKYIYIFLQFWSNDVVIYLLTKFNFLSVYRFVGTTCGKNESKNSCILCILNCFKNSNVCRDVLSGPDVLEFLCQKREVFPFKKSKHCRN